MKLTFKKKLCTASDEEIVLLAGAIVGILVDRGYATEELVLQLVSAIHDGEVEKRAATLRKGCPLNN